MQQYSARINSTGRNILNVLLLVLRHTMFSCDVLVRDTDDDNTTLNCAVRVVRASHVTCNMQHET